MIRNRFKQVILYQNHKTRVEFWSNFPTTTRCCILTKIAVHETTRKRRYCACQAVVDYQQRTRSLDMSTASFVASRRIEWNVLTKLQRSQWRQISKSVTWNFELKPAICLVFKQLKACQIVQGSSKLRLLDFWGYSPISMFCRLDGNNGINPPGPPSYVEEEGGSQDNSFVEAAHGHVSSITYSSDAPIERVVNWVSASKASRGTTPLNPAKEVRSESPEESPNAWEHRELTNINGLNGWRKARKHCHRSLGWIKRERKVSHGENFIVDSELRARSIPIFKSFKFVSSVRLPSIIPLISVIFCSIATTTRHSKLDADESSTVMYHCLVRKHSPIRKTSKLVGRRGIDPHNSFWPTRRMNCSYNTLVQGFQCHGTSAHPPYQWTSMSVRSNPQSNPQESFRRRWSTLGIWCLRVNGKKVDLLIIEHSP